MKPHKYPRVREMMQRHFRIKLTPTQIEHYARRGGRSLRREIVVDDCTDTYVREHFIQVITDWIIGPSWPWPSNSHSEAYSTEFIRLFKIACVQHKIEIV